MYDGSSFKIVADCPTTEQEPYMTVTVTVTVTHTVSDVLPATSCSTTTTVTTEYLSITPTNCLQSTHTKVMSTTVETGNIDTTVTGGDSNTSFNTATGGSTNNSNQGTACNSSPVILGAFIAVLAALLVAVTTGWIVTCVVNRRKDKASTTRY